MVAIEAIYLFDEHNNPIFEHVYTGRPSSAGVVVSQYLSHTPPRPSVIYLPSLNPPTLLFSLIQDRLLFLCTTSADVEPLLVLEFLYRLADALGEFLGSPILATKIDSSYDVVAQIVGEMCDAGSICTTETNALREVVEVPSWMGGLFGGFSGFGTQSSSSLSSNPPTPQFGTGISNNANFSSGGSAIPWRRANVRHTSNELYVDIIEKLSVILAPSGRPLSALASGTLLFTAQISGVPDLLLTLTAPGGKTGIKTAMDLPCFHPCVRLSKWRDRPGELSFVPPDGRFVLASYECNLLPEMFLSDTEKLPSPSLNLPASIEIRPSLGQYGDELEVRLILSNRSFVSSGTPSDTSSAAMKSLGGTGRFGALQSALNSTNGGNSVSPSVQDLVVTIPISSAVRNVDEIRVTKGEAHFSAGDGGIEWRISTKEAAIIGQGVATLSCVLIGPLSADAEEEDHITSQNIASATWDYDEDTLHNGSDQSSKTAEKTRVPLNGTSTESQELKKQKQNAGLMPQSATLSFSVKGWLASGIKVESLSVNTKTSKGIGAGVTPYKGVKYHTISQRGIEARC